MSVEEKIKRYLLENKVSQVFICHHTGMIPSKLSFSLNGKRGLTFEEYELICGALRVPVDTFLEPRTRAG